MENWRFIDSGFCDGKTNMDTDMALTRAVAAGEAPPTLRVYGWNPPAISLGFHQSRVDIDADKCRRDHVDIVVRPTGGRAVLHADELTYSVILPENSRFYSRQTMQVYQILSNSLVAALQLLDIDIRFERAARTPAGTPRQELNTMCYASTIQYEIGLDGKKLVGSAQRRFEGAVLQHGSILVGRRHLDIVDYIAGLTEQKRRAMRRYLHDHTVCLNDLTPKPVAYRHVAAVIKKGFQNQLGIHFEAEQPKTNVGLF